MGYRTRLGRIPKECKDKYSSAKDEYDKSFWGEDSDHAAYRPQEHEELYELGKYVSFEEHRTPFYNFKLDDCEFEIISKDGLKVIIEYYREQTLEYYKNLKDNPTEGAVETHLESMINQWEGKFSKPYYLDETNTDGAIVSSWTMQYSIFNLVQIYRYFDWENDYLIYSGW